MSPKKRKIFNIVASVLLAIVVLAMFGYVIFKEDLSFTISNFTFTNVLAFGCVLASFLFSLLCIQKMSKKILITLALALNVVADVFMVLLPGIVENSVLIAVCLYCASQFIYLVHTLTLSRGMGIRIVNVALRVAVCLITYFIAMQYVTLDTLQIISMMCILNAFVTLIILLFYIKTEWLLFLGLFVLFAFQFFSMLQGGGWLTILQITNADFIEFLSKYDVAFMCYIPAQLLIALASIWAKRKD